MLIQNKLSDLDKKQMNNIQCMNETGYPFIMIFQTHKLASQFWICSLRNLFGFKTNQFVSIPWFYLDQPVQSISSFAFGQSNSIGPILKFGLIGWSEEDEEKSMTKVLLMNCQLRNENESFNSKLVHKLDGPGTLDDKSQLPLIDLIRSDSLIGDPTNLWIAAAYGTELFIWNE